MIKEIVKWESLDIDNKVFSKFKMLVVEVDLYGVKYDFLVDTGTNESIIRDSIAEMLYDRIHIPDTDDGFIITGIAEEVVKTRESIVTITVANMNEAIPCNIVNMDNINKFFQGDIQVSGILGNIFLRRAGWILDFHRLVIWVPNIYNDTE